MNRLKHTLRNIRTKSWHCTLRRILYYQGMFANSVLLRKNALDDSPKCKQEMLINAKNFEITLIKEPDAKTQSR